MVLSFVVLLAKSCRFDQSEAHFLLGELQLNPLQFLPGIIETQMGVGVHGHTNLRMAHQILQGLGIHATSGLLAAVSMTAHMRSDFR